MGSRPRRSVAHEQAVARRLELLGAELSGIRVDTDPTLDRSADPAGPTHTRVRADRVPAAAPVPVVPLALPGRHAARGRLSLGPAQLAVVGLVVLAGLAAVGWWLLGGRSSEVAVPPASTAASSPAHELVSLEPAAGSTGGATVGAAASVTVDVAGRVRRPGIAVLDAGSRVVDALEAAGGAKPGVDLAGLNLARVLVDGEQVLVGVDPPAGVAAGAATGSTGSAVSPAALVNINTADQVGLESLPEVGPVTAQAILAYRTEHGAFTSVDQLLDVTGIGEQTLAQITPYVTL